MVSNCEAGNDRQAYVESLRKYIDVSNAKVLFIYIFN